MISPSAPNPDERIPCVDDLCVGILDDSGTCGTCGRVGEVRTFRGPVKSRDDADGASAVAGDDDAYDGAEGDDSAEGDDDAEGNARGDGDGDGDGEGDADGDRDEERIPCDDELCTGIVRSNGRCGTCGRVHTAT